MKNYELIIIRLHGQVCVSAVAEKVKALRIDALLKLRAYITHYDKLGYINALLVDLLITTIISPRLGIPIT